MKTFAEYFTVIAIFATTISIAWALRPMFKNEKK